MLNHFFNEYLYTSYFESHFRKVASLVAQLVKNLPAMLETWVLSLGWEDPLEKGTATHSSILARRIPWTVCIVHGVAKSQAQQPEHLHYYLHGSQGATRGQHAHPALPLQRGVLEDGILFFSFCSHRFYSVFTDPRAGQKD